MLGGAEPESNHSLRPEAGKHLAQAARKERDQGRRCRKARCSSNLFDVFTDAIVQLAQLTSSLLDARFAMLRSVRWRVSPANRFPHPFEATPALAIC